MRDPAFLFVVFLLMAVAPATAEVIVAASPADRPPPAYPPGAEQTVGFVKLRFDVGADGHVGNLKIIESKPKAVFDKAATESVARWTYHPRTRDGQPVAQLGNVAVLNFKPGLRAPSLIYAPCLDYPHSGFVLGLEGAVRLMFDVSARGTTTNIRVNSSGSPDIFEHAGIDCVTRWLFTPDALPALNLVAVIPFTITRASALHVPDKPRQPNYPMARQPPPVTDDCVRIPVIETDGSASSTNAGPCLHGGFSQDAARDAVNTTKHFAVAKDQGYLKPGEWVKLRYTLTPQGRARHVEVLATSSPGLSPARAVEQLREMAMQPVIESGVAVEEPVRVMTIAAKP